LHFKQAFLSSKQNSCSAGGFQSTGDFPGARETRRLLGDGKASASGEERGLCSSAVTVAGGQ